MIRRRTRRGIVLGSLDSSLLQIVSNPAVRSMEEGEAFICTTCGFSTKPCSLHPGDTCPLMIRESTQTELLEGALNDCSTGVYGRCIRCGERIPLRQLSRNPLRELCSQCQQRHTKRRRHESSGV